jgi:hypothetical protein
MMDERELRKRIKALDPMTHGVEARPVDEIVSQEMLEGIMEHPVESTRNGPAFYLLAAAAVAALVIGGVALFNGDTAEPDVVASPPLELSLGESDTLASCLAPSAEVLADTPLAFAGTATSVDGEKVTLTVDEWFVGGDAGTVELSAPGGLVALTGGIDFVQGEQYLISAYDGTVNYCGFSGPVTPELQAMYDEAFPG